jgi:hypothetical protein
LAFKPFKLGFKYLDGKILVYKWNPGLNHPAWAVDVREILLIMFIGIGALLLIIKDQYNYAVQILMVLAGYVTGRTIPGKIGISTASKAEEKEE